MIQVVLVSPPTTPLAIELSIRHRRQWWEPEDGDRVQRWQISADVTQLIPCGEVFRHVADVAVDVIDLRHPAASGGHDWATGFAAGCVADRQAGRLLPDLEERISPGAPQAVVLRSIFVAEPWRGRRLAELLLASVLRFWTRSARLALCRVVPEDFADQCPDPLAAEFAAMRVAALIERLGFFPWNGVYVGDLASPALRAARDSVIQQWWPDEGDSHA